MSKRYFDENEIRKAISVIKKDSVTGIYEIRIAQSNHKNPTVGYFSDVDVMLSKLKRQDLRNKNVYIVLNEIDRACYAKTARDEFIVGASGTGDKDIIGRWWLLVDIDPIRPTDTSSSNASVEKAKNKAEKVHDFLKQQGFPEPLIGFSGNGYHLVYRICMKNTPDNNDVIKRFLNTLNILFTDTDNKIDTANFNASRVCKLYGTLAQKGSDTPEYPHRMSYIISIPQELSPVSIEYIDKVNSIIPDKPDTPQRYNNYNGNQFDLVEWMNKYGLRYREYDTGDGTRFILDHCPFNADHKGKDAMIFRGRNGAIGFHCFHDSCQGKTWKDVRVLFEPDAYERKWQQQDKRMYGHYKRNADNKPPEPIQPTEDNPVWFTPMDVFNKPKKEVHYIRTGYTGIDHKMYGLKKKGISILTGLRSAGKSTWLSELILNVIQDGNIVGCYSGELDEEDFMRWIVQQAAGRNGVEPGRYEGQYNVPLRNRKIISEWLEGKLFLYNNNYGNNFQQIVVEVEKKIKSDNLDLIVLDNLMALDIEDLDSQKYDAQKKFVLALKKLAKQEDVHIMFVAHPRKTVSFLRLEDISGSGDLANAVDNAFLIHRNNEDFKIRSREMFKWKDDHVAYSGTNVIEVAKDRESGTQDWFIPIWYEKESRRMKNSVAENILYGWNADVADDEGFLPLPEDIEF